MLANEAAQALRVLVLMPSTRDSERTSQLVAEGGHAATVCVDLPELCRELRAGAGVVVLTDEAIAGDVTGQLAEAMREQPAWSALPVIVVAREGATESIQRLAADIFAGLIVVERPVRTRTLLSLIQSGLRARRNQYQIREAIALREAQSSALRAQEERLRFVLEAGGLGSWELDVSNQRLSCSLAYAAQLGRAHAGLDYAALLEAIHPEDRGRVLAAVERSVRDSSDYDDEYRVRWPSGEIRWLMVRGRPTHDAATGTRRLVGVSLDITERKRTDEALKASQAELAKQAEQLRMADQRKDEFLATLAHELRNPLAPIRTGMELLRVSQRPESTEKALGVMNRQVTHMVRLIDDLLDVSRITRGKLDLKRAPVRLGTLINAAVEASRPFIERGQHSLSLKADESICVDADFTRIAQVIGNLLNNCAKYTPAGGRIELCAWREHDMAVIAVRDNGVGIPTEQLSQVFEMFSQVNQALDRAQGGLGIGLALVRRLVELHGGSVEAESPGPGRGSTFTVRLPLARTAEIVDENGVPVPRYVGEQKRVLVVDDNDDACELLALMLQSADCQTKTASDGPSALRAVHAWSPHVVILDIGMPGMNGYEVARALRTRQAALPMRLIALTGWGTQEDQRRALDAGFDVHLTKPVEASQLYRAIADRPM